jgi:hypothetical protein
MRNIPDWLFLVGVIGLVGATILCSVVSYTVAQKVSYDLVIGFGVQQDNPDQRIAQYSTSTPTLMPTIAPVNTIAPGETITPEPTIEETVEIAVTVDPLADLPQIDDPRRITILLMGIDERSGVENENGYRSDTMILVWTR